MEQVFFRLHVRSVSLFSGLFHAKSREFIEKILLISAFLLLALLVGLHTNFVNLNHDNNCFSYLVNKDDVRLQDFDIIRIFVSNDKLEDNMIKSFLSKTGKNATGYIIPYKHESRTNDIDPIFASSFGKDTPDNKLIFSDENRSKEQCLENQLGTSNCDINIFPQKEPQIPESEFTSGNAFKYSTVILRSLLFLRDKVRSFFSSPFLRDFLRMERLYIFSLEKAYLLLPYSLRQKHNISQAIITVSKHSTCFGGIGRTSIGGVGLAWMVHNIIGYDTIVMNWLITQFEGTGYLYNTNSREMYNLNLSTEFKRNRQGWSHILFYKIGILFTTLFLFFTTTTLVSFTLRETQERMLKFTHLLQHYVRHRLPYAPLVLTHVVESLVFVPIMIGILFFLFEFFSDQLLAFLVMSLVWMAEVFSVVSVRTQPSIRFFPRAFFLYFSLFHIYFFSFPFGYSYIALLTTTLFLQHSMLHCWNHFEVAALHSGVVSATRPREVSGLLGWIQAEGGDGGPIIPQTSDRFISTNLVHPQYGTASSMTGRGQRERRNSEPDSPSTFIQHNQPHRLAVSSRSRRESDPSPSLPSLHLQAPTTNNSYQYEDYRPLTNLLPTSTTTSTSTTIGSVCPLVTTVDHVELSRRIQQQQIKELINYNATITAAETLRSHDSANENRRNNNSNNNNIITQERTTTVTTTGTAQNQSQTDTSSSIGSVTIGAFSPTRNNIPKTESKVASPPPRSGVTSSLWSTFWSQSSTGNTIASISNGNSSSSGTTLMPHAIGIAGGGPFSPSRLPALMSQPRQFPSTLSSSPRPAITTYRTRHRAATTSSYVNNCNDNTSNSNSHNRRTVAEDTDSNSRSIVSTTYTLKNAGGWEVSNASSSYHSSETNKPKVKGDAEEQRRTEVVSSLSSRLTNSFGPQDSMTGRIVDRTVGEVGGGDGNSRRATQNQNREVQRNTGVFLSNSNSSSPTSSHIGYGYGYTASSYTVFGVDLYDSSLSENVNENSTNSNRPFNSNSRSSNPPTDNYSSSIHSDNMHVISNSEDVINSSYSKVESMEGEETADDQLGLSEIFM